MFNKVSQTNAFGRLVMVLCCIMLLLAAPAMANNPGNSRDNPVPADGSGCADDNPVPDEGPGDGDEVPDPDGIDDVVRLIDILYGPTLPIIH